MEYSTPRLLATIVPLLLWSGPSAASETSERFTLSYHLWEGGFHALSFETRVDRKQGDYDIEFSARTEGMMRWIYPYTMQARAEGVEKDEILNPRQFSSFSQTRSKERKRSLTYQTDGTIEVREDPPRDHPKEALPQTATAGALDPASAALAILQGFVRRGTCEATVPVFDGKRRFNLNVTQVGDRQIAASKYGMYSGRATVCQVTFEQLSGFEEKGRKHSRFLDNLRIWLAPLQPGRRAVPVRLEGKTKLGYIVLHLVAATLGNQSAISRR